MDYNFDRLGPDKFENMVQSLIQNILGIDTQIFGDGPDGQREAYVEDGRITLSGKEYTGKMFFQMKYKEPGGNQKPWDWLRTQLKKELDGFRKKKAESPEYLPQVWIFFTNVVLTPVKDSGLRDKANEFVKEYHDVIPKIVLCGPDEISAMLDNNRDVATRYDDLIRPGDVLKKIYDRVSESEKTVPAVTLQNRENDQYGLWTEPMFLETNRGKTLEDVYIKPDYIVGEGEERQKDIDVFFDNIIEDKDHKHKIGLILGAPGIGKSTLFSYFLNREDVVYDPEEKGEDVYFYKSEHANRQIFLYRFSDMNRMDINWNEAVTDYAEKVLSRILESMPHVTSASDLRNTILLLDGFDECAAPDQGQRLQILLKLQSLWGRYARIFVTCRENYISDLSSNEVRKQISVITLQKFDFEQIASFIAKYRGLEKNDEKVERIRKLLLGIENEKNGVDELFLKPQLRMKKKKNDEDSPLQVYGIPIILYMVIALGKVEHSLTYGEVYDEIFAEEGGIYDRMLSKQSYDQNREKETLLYRVQGREESYKHFVGDVSRTIAYYMFRFQEDQSARKDRTEAFLEEQGQRFYDNADKVIEMSTILSSGMFMIVDTPARDSGDSTIRFIHKSMYEYFMADYIFRTIRQMLATKKVITERQSKNSAEILSELLGYRLLSVEIGNFLKEKLKCLEFEAFEDKLIDLFNAGLTVYDRASNRAERKEKEKHIFENLMYITQLFRAVKGNNTKTTQILFDAEDKRKLVSESFGEYLRMGHYQSPGNQMFDLSGINLAYMDLSHADLTGYIFDGCNATETNFRYSDLTYAKFRGTILTHAAFTGADMNMTEPSAKRLLNDPDAQIPWTEIKGYYPDPYNAVASWNGKRIHAGETLEFGNYIQDSAKSTPITWRILEIKGNRALLLADKILDVRKYNEDFVETSWADCSLREWLNGKKEGDFLVTAFSSVECEKIADTLIEPHKNINPKYEFGQGKATIDKVFLLSGEEVVEYLATKEKTANNIVYNIGGELLRTEATRNVERSRNIWWLRSVGFGGRDALFVCNDGDVGTDGSSVGIGAVGVRPALWLNLES